MEQGLLSPCDRVTMVGVPIIGDARNFLGICVQDGGAIPEIDPQASISILYPPILSLQTLEQREVGWRKSKSVASF